MHWFIYIGWLEGGATNPRDLERETIAALGVTAENRHGGMITPMSYPVQADAERVAAALKARFPSSEFTVRQDD